MAITRKKVCINLNPETIILLEKLTGRAFLTKSRYIEQLILEKAHDRK